MNIALAPAWLKPAPDSALAATLRQGRSLWSDGIHVLWSVWVFITPVFGLHYDLRWFLLTLGSYPLFLLLFWMAMASPRRQSWRYAVALGGMSLALMPWYPSGVSYFIYGCVLLCTSRSPYWSYLLQLVAMNSAFVAVCIVLGYPWSVMLTVPCTAFIIGVIVNVERINSEKDAALKLSHEEVRRLAATAERERIGRDLHDLLGHTLSLITLKLELSRKLFDRDSEAARREVIEAEKVARHALAEVRAAVTGIRATDLAAELASARLLLESSGVAIDYGAPPALPVEVERDLALVLREAATNIARHAGATHANVAFEVIDGGLCVTVADNGRGGIDAEGNGLTGMRERVRALGGRLQIHSQRGQGTRLRVVVPQPDRRQPQLPAAEPAITVLPLEPRAS